MGSVQVRFYNCEGLVQPLGEQTQAVTVVLRGKVRLETLGACGSTLSGKDSRCAYTPQLTGLPRCCLFWTRLILNAEPCMVHCSRC